ncbi:MAG TPA: MFS transporter [Pseudonocardia sp.]|nr:MFS transporter [Pseudonocardia sp.]
MADLREHPAAGVLRARTAVAVTFAVNGLAYGSFISRTPAIRDALGLSSAQLGLLLLCLSAGSISGLPLAGVIVHRLGAARTVFAGVVGVAIGLASLATGLVTGTVLPAALGLLVFGLSTGVWDVAMNVEGADVERRLGRSLMPRLHAAFSLGMVAGAGLGAGSAATGLPLALQVGVVAALLPVLMPVVVRHFLAGSGAPGERKGGSGALTAWREPRTLLVGLLVLGFAFTEGSANDWIAVALVDGYGTSETVGAIAFGLFVGAMTIGRLFGTTVLDRFGRVAALRGTALLALAGLLLVLLGGSTPVALVGAVLWGLGAALGFPIGMSAAADDPARAAARVAVVGSIGYTAFLAGPPLIGLLAEQAGILRGLFVVVGALALGLLASGAARPLREPEDAPRP